MNYNETFFLSATYTYLSLLRRLRACLAAAFSACKREDHLNDGKENGQGGYSQHDILLMGELEFCVLFHNHVRISIVLQI